MKSSKLITQLIAIVITVLAGVAYAAATNWTPPVGIPPAGNTDAPINVGGNAQEKLGGLLLGTGLTAAQNALVIPNANMLVGTTVGRAAPNGSGGNIIANDMYFSSIGKWASELTGSTTTVVTNITTGSAYTPGEWFTDKLLINYINDGYFSMWNTTQEVRFTAGHAINRVRLRGSSDNGGYCYAYWGTGHVATTLESGAMGVYSVDNSTWYNNAMQYEAALIANDGPCYNPDTGNIDGYTCARPYCRLGGPVTANYPNADTGGDITYTCEAGVDTCPGPNFSNNGIAELCQTPWYDGALPTIDQVVNIPKDAVVTLQGRHVNGSANDFIKCGLDIQYAP